MVIKQFTTPESTNRTETHIIPLSALIELKSVSANTGSVRVVRINGDNVTVEVSGGQSVHQELQSGSFTPSESKNVTSSRTNTSRSFPNTISYNADGYVGVLEKSGSTTSRQTGGSYTPAESKPYTTYRSIVVSWADWEYRSGSWVSTYIWMANIADTSPIQVQVGITPGSIFYGTLPFVGFTGAISNASPPKYAGSEGQVATTNRYQSAQYSGTVWKEGSDTRTYSYTQNYAGTVTKPAVDTRQYTSHYRYILTFNYEGNQAPVAVPMESFSAEIDSERTFLMTEVFTDPDGDAMTFTATSSNTQNAIVTRSTSDENSFAVKATAVGNADISFTATDARGEKSTQVLKVTVMNRLPILALNSDIGKVIYEGTSVLLKGTIHDKDVGHIINVKYRINDLLPRAIMTQVSAGAALPFEKTLLFRDIQFWDGANAVTGNLEETTNHILSVWGEDDQGGKTASQIFTFTVTHNRSPNASPMPDVSDVTGTQRSILLTNYFTDPDGDVLNYLVTSSDESIASAAVEDQTLVVTTTRSGQAVISIAADDGKGRTASGSFQFHVLNRKPSVKVFKEDGSEAYAAEHFGDHVAAFKVGYMVDDLDVLDKLNVTERVNGKDIRVIKDVVRNEPQVFDLTSAWGHVAEGDNTVSILVTDGSGSSTEVTHAFRATGNELHFSLKAPVITSLPAERIVVSGHTDIAPGATFNVMACNNGLDASPAWEDVTKHFGDGTVHEFSNQTKTATDWAVDIEFRITQGTSIRLSAVSGFGFAFE